MNKIDAPNGVVNHGVMYANWLTVIGIPAHQPIYSSIYPFSFDGISKFSDCFQDAGFVFLATKAFFLQQKERKVSREPYFKHVLRVVMHLADLPGFDSLPLTDKRVLIGAALFHDAIELNRKNGNPIGGDNLMALISCQIEHSEAKRICRLVELLTPSKEGDDFKVDGEYVKYKTADFRDKYTYHAIDWEYLRLIKEADILANIEETVQDIQKYGAEQVVQMRRSLDVQKEIFQKRIDIIIECNPDSPFLEKLQQKNSELQQL